jgi:hypothetical protein
MEKSMLSVAKLTFYFLTVFKLYVKKSSESDQILIFSEARTEIYEKLVSFYSFKPNVSQKCQKM